MNIKSLSFPQKIHSYIKKQPNKAENNALKGIKYF